MTRDQITVHFKLNAKQNLKTEGLCQAYLQGAEDCWDYIKENEADTYEKGLQDAWKVFAHVQSGELSFEDGSKGSIKDDMLNIDRVDLHKKRYETPSTRSFLHPDSGMIRLPLMNGGNHSPTGGAFYLGLSDFEGVPAITIWRYSKDNQKWEAFLRCYPTAMSGNGIAWTKLTDPAPQPPQN